MFPVMWVPVRFQGGDVSTPIAGKGAFLVLNLCWLVLIISCPSWVVGVIIFLTSESCLTFVICLVTFTGLKILAVSCFDCS